MSLAQKKTAQKGFTLIEIMAVLIVIGIATAVITLSMGDGTRPQHIKAASRLLFNSLNLASEEAVTGNLQLGLRFDVNKNDAAADSYSYQWLRYDSEALAWINTEIEGLEEITLPEFVVLNLEVEGQSIVIGTHAAEEKMFEVKIETDKTKKTDKEILYPDLYFLSSGEMQNFTISIADIEKEQGLEENRYVIQGDTLGQLSYKRPDEQE